MWKNFALQARWKVSIPFLPELAADWENLKWESGVGAFQENKEAQDHYFPGELRSSCVGSGNLFDRVNWNPFPEYLAREQGHPLYKGAWIR
jgi:hypothetical protein